MDAFLEFSGLFWLIVAVVLAIAEAMTIQLVAIWPAVGALVTMIPAVLKAPLWLQLVIFLAVSLLLLIFTRPILYKALKPRLVRTNADSVVGKVAVVTETINNTYQAGRVMVDGLSWSARSTTGDILEPDLQVRVDAIDGVKLIVHPLEPVWTQDVQDIELDQPQDAAK